MLISMEFYLTVFDIGMIQNKPQKWSLSTFLPKICTQKGQKLIHNGLKIGQNSRWGPLVGAPSPGYPIIAADLSHILSCRAFQYNSLGTKLFEVAQTV